MNRKMDNMIIGVDKIAPRQFQAFAKIWGRDAVRPIGPVFKTQWQAAQQARVFVARRKANRA